MGDHLGTLGAVRFIYCPCLTFGRPLFFFASSEQAEGPHGVPNRLAQGLLQPKRRKTPGPPGGLSTTGTTARMCLLKVLGWATTLGGGGGGEGQRRGSAEMKPALGRTHFWVDIWVPVHRSSGDGSLSRLQTVYDAYGHTTGNTPEPVRFQKLSLVRPS